MNENINEKKKLKILYVTCYNHHGDHLSVCGMINFLSLYYDKIYLLCHWNFCVVIDDLYRNNHKVRSMSYDYFMLEYCDDSPNKIHDFLFLIYFEHVTSKTGSGCLNEFGEFYSPGYVTPYDFKTKKFNGTIYSEKNPIGKKCGFNIQIKNNLDWVSKYYNVHGFPREIVYKNFFFERFYEYEQKLFCKLNLISNHYSVICEYNKIPDFDYNVVSTTMVRYDDYEEYYQSKIDKSYIKNDNVVNIHLLSKKYFDIVKIIENANEVNLIENSFLLFVYLLQMSGKMKKVPINVHCYARKTTPYKFMDMNIELKNWNFIYE